MTPEIAAKLREPFAAEKVGKLPRIWCGACRDAKGKVCTQHRKSRCDECQNSITDAHLHLDYVGHADVTDRLLQVDPEWTWEPLAFTAEGLPAFGNGGLWIRLTVAGTTRLGFGDAPGKAGGDAVKEVIGDAIRNAALRFGVGLDLWRKERPVEESEEKPASRPRSRRATASEAASRDSSRDDQLPQEPNQRKALFAGLGQLGLAGDDKRDERLRIISAIVKREVTSTSDLTYNEAAAVIEAVKRRIRETAGGAS